MFDKDTTCPHCGETIKYIYGYGRWKGEYEKHTCPEPEKVEEE